MAKFYYDLHLHSCLSPCGDEDMTPNNIVNMSALLELDIIALTDHNSLKNCPAFFKVAENSNIVAVTGCELTTSEEIHVVCLFEFLDDAMRFDRFLESRRPPIKNKSEIFGRQTVLDENDEEICEENNLLIVASDISLDEVKDVMKEFNGVCFPAHIDRSSNSVTSVFGFFPSDYGFSFAEIFDRQRENEFREKEAALKNVELLSSSDAHYLEDIRERQNYIELDADRENLNEVRKKLFEYLRKEL